jgi:hypothetical protein
VVSMIRLAPAGGAGEGAARGRDAVEQGDHSTGGGSAEAAAVRALGRASHLLLFLPNFSTVRGTFSVSVYLYSLVD